MLRLILSIAGRPGLYKLVSQGKNMLIVESLAAPVKRFPVYARDKVISLGDVSIYTADGEDTPLGGVLELVKEKNDGKAVDIKALGDDKAIRKYFAEVMPNFDDERVYTADIKKLLQWYNILVNAGITEFVEKESTEEEKAE